MLGLLHLLYCIARTVLYCARFPACAICAMFYFRLFAVLQSFTEASCTAMFHRSAPQWTTRNDCSSSTGWSSVAQCDSCTAVSEWYGCSFGFNYCTGCSLKCQSHVGAVYRTCFWASWIRIRILLSPSKKVRKTLFSTALWLLFDFLSLKMM